MIPLGEAARLQLIPALVVSGCVLLCLLAGCEREQPVSPPTEVQQEAFTDTSQGLHIAEILRSPEAYKGRLVTIRGKCTPGLAFEFVDEQPYLVQDESGQIWVITSSTMPPKDSALTVRGEVAAPYQLKGRHFSVALIERERRGP
jgi:hypothetical protein